MSPLSCHEKRLLHLMEEELRRSAPHLAAMSATFAAVVADEPMPHHEDVCRLSRRWFAALKAPVIAITRALRRQARRRRFTFAT